MKDRIVMSTLQRAEFETLPVPVGAAERHPTIRFSATAATSRPTAGPIRSDAQPSVAIDLIREA